MQTYGIEKYGIVNPKKVDRNHSPAVLTEEALKTEPARLTDTGALLVETGAYTGRSPKDRFIVDEPAVSAKIGWGTENKKFPLDKFELIYKKVGEYLSGKNVYIFDGFAGADPKYRVSVRVINELASENLFMNNMLIRPTAAELKSFKEDYTLIAVPGLKLDPKECGTNSEAAILLCLEKKIILVVADK
ncbi:MAG: phosphoenolpyruvate carboxykinase (ATP), partial [Clostridiales bacterium]|nr:phosphoenolpyruvate carboxykinase (ATP) [Clostridiales bacterium]